MTDDKRGVRVGGRLRRAWRRGRWFVLGLVLVLVLPPLFGALALRVSYAGDLRDDARTRGKDAIWLGHAWVDGRKKDADLAAFAERIKGTGIRDLYVHAGPLEHDGTLPATAYPRAKWLIDGVHRTMPGIRVQAWLGDILATEGTVGLRLEDARSRRRWWAPRGRSWTPASTASTSTWSRSTPVTGTT